MLIRPLSLWVAYTLTSPSAVQRRLPDNLKLAPVRLLSTDSHVAAPSPKLLFNSYDVSSTWMKGHRLDIQTFAADVHKDTVHLVVLDCVSNVQMWDPQNGIRRANAVVSRRRAGEDFGRLCISRRKKTLFEVEGCMYNETNIPDREFIVDANRECYFGNTFPGYKMSFDEEEIMRPVRRLPLSSVKTNALWKSVRSKRPSHAFVHTGPMTFDVKVPEMCL